MANIIRKATNTVAVSLSEENVLSSFFAKYTLDYFVKKYSDKYMIEHYNAVKNIITSIVEHKQNHIILEAPTQSGKTTVMTLLYLICNDSFIRTKLGIKRIIYLTGDNQVELSNQNMQRFWQQCCLPKPPIRISGKNSCIITEVYDKISEYEDKGRIPFIMIRNQDCVKFKKLLNSLSNTLIMVDESHYGTRQLNSQVNKLLQNFGKDFSGDPKKLLKANTYILSVSATPYNEENADDVNNDGDLLKGIVNYIPGREYIGFSRLYHNDMIEGVHDNSIIKDIDKFTDFLKEQRAKMDKIYEETKKRCAMIVRMQGEKTILRDIGKNGLKNIASKHGFDIKIITSEVENIDYFSAYDMIRYSQFEGCDNVLVIVKQGFSYGISIPDDIKPLIATIYDYRPNSGKDSTTDSTEQGLLGRMTGYHPNGINKYLKIYINQVMLIGLEHYHIDRDIESPNIPNTKSVKCRCTRDEWDRGIYEPTKTKTAEEVKLSYIDLWNNAMNAPLIFSGKVVDDFFERHTEFDYKELFDVTKDSSIKNNTIPPIAEAFNREVLKGRFKTPIVDTRRQISDDDKIANNLGYSTPILSNGARKKWRTPDNVGKEGWVFVADIRHRKGKKGIEIRIPWGIIGFSKDLITYRDRKVYNGYDKTPTKEEELEVAMA
jgi:Type III restriction enzyme, res subunit.